MVVSELDDVVRRRSQLRTTELEAKLAAERAISERERREAMEQSALLQDFLSRIDRSRTPPLPVAVVTSVREGHRRRQWSGVKTSDISWTTFLRQDGAYALPISRAWFITTCMEFGIGWPTLIDGKRYSVQSSVPGQEIGSKVIVRRETSWDGPHLEGTDIVWQNNTNPGPGEPPYWERRSTRLVEVLAEALESYAKYEYPLSYES